MDRFPTSKEFSKELEPATSTIKSIQKLTKEDSEKVDKIFKKYPELASVFDNNKELYNTYLENIFPNASEEFRGKLFFHGTKNPIEGGKFKISERSLARGLWFTKQLSYAKMIERFSDEGDNPLTYGVVLNIKNPKHFYDKSGGLLVQRPSDFAKEYDKTINDAAVFHHPQNETFSNLGGYNQIVIFNENQVHIIGDDDDITKAKEFVKSYQTTIEQPQQTIKEGVAELFESNPELANAVYSALGVNNVITSNDKIVWGHPAIGKTTMLESNPDAFMDWDNEFNRKRDSWIANKSNTVIGTPEFKKARNEYMINYNNHKDYIAFVTEEWNKAKEKANKENKTLIASPHMLLNLFPSDFDKVITMNDKTFMDRAIRRSGGDEVNSKLWKEGINETLKSVDKSKIIETDKYINDLFVTPQQKQQAQQLYSQYIEQTGKQDIEGFKQFVKDNSTDLQLQQNKKLNQEDPLIRDKYFKNNNTTTSTDILTNISESNHPLNRLAEHLIKYAEVNNVQIELVPTDNLSKEDGCIVTGKHWIIS